VVYDIFKEGGCKRYWFILGWRRETRQYVTSDNIGGWLVCCVLGFCGVVWRFFDAVSLCFGLVGVRGFVVGEVGK